MDKPNLLSFSAAPSSNMEIPREYIQPVTLNYINRSLAECFYEEENIELLVLNKPDVLINSLTELSALTQMLTAIQLFKNTARKLTLLKIGPTTNTI